MATRSSAVSGSSSAGAASRSASRSARLPPGPGAGSAGPALRPALTLVGPAVGVQLQDGADLVVGTEAELGLEGGDAVGLALALGLWPRPPAGAVRGPRSPGLAVEGEPEKHEETEGGERRGEAHLERRVVVPV